MLGISLKRVRQGECSCSWLLSKSRKLVFIISDMPLSCLCHVLKKTQDRPTDFLTPLPCGGKLLVVSMPFSEGFSKFERQSMDQKMDNIQSLTPLEQTQIITAENPGLPTFILNYIR